MSALTNIGLNQRPKSLGRQQNREFGSVADGRLQMDPAPGVHDKTPDNRKAESGTAARRFRRELLLEHAAHHLRWNARAIVPNGDRHHRRTIAETIAINETLR